MATLSPSHSTSERRWQRQAFQALYLIRHGEGLHDVKEKEVGRAEWDVSLIDPYKNFHAVVEADTL